MGSSIISCVTGQDITNSTKKLWSKLGEPKACTSELKMQKLGISLQTTLNGFRIIAPSKYRSFFRQGIDGS